MMWGELAATEPAPRAERSLLRFLTCGSVDDGKSTLIGRLLFDARLLADDQLAAVLSSGEADAATGEPDLAHLLDGLQAEREQGITIDVAYRYFATPRRAFIVADTPGHVQYTRNMATGASVSDLAVILVDARKGLRAQTRRHSFIARLLGIRQFVLAVNKMDLADFSQARFEEISSAYRQLLGKLGSPSLRAIPLVARLGDNVVQRSGRMPWYQGPTLIDHLETVDVAGSSAERPLRMPVQWVNRGGNGAGADFRGYAGTLASGSVAAGAPVVVLPSGRSARVRQVLAGEGPLDRATAGNAVTLVLDSDIDISRGDVLVAPEDRPVVADQLAADIVWMAEEPLLPGRQYLLKCATHTVSATVTDLKYKLEFEHLEEVSARSWGLNDIGACNISLARPIVFEPYEINRVLGAFIIIDKASNATVGAGMIRFALRRAANISWQALDIDKMARADLKGQRPLCVWFTGLSGSGKSTLANLLEKRLHADGRHTYILDGDNVRHGLNRDLGFTDADRVENIRRVAEVARLMADAGLIVIVAFISPFNSERQMARDLFAEGEFIEVFVDTPLEVCERRDPKGLYKKARAGLLPHFTGIDSGYEPPQQPEVHLRGDADAPELLVEQLMSAIDLSPPDRG
jgi:bifunctional enzyme CysN/CysC